MDIVRAVLDGAMPSVELLPRSLGFRSVLVHPHQVKRTLSLREAQSGLSPQEVAQRLGIYTSGVTHLRKAYDREGRPLLCAVATANSRGTIHYRFPREEVDRFARQHVKLGDLACERGVSARAMSRALADADIQPIVRRQLLNAAYYRRADL